MSASTPDTTAPFLATEYLAAKWQNERGVIDRHFAQSGFKLSALVIEHCVAGDISPQSNPVLLNWLWNCLTSPTWVSSAHTPGFELPDTSAPQLDLMACETASHLAEVLEVLQPWINAQSPNLSKSILHEIDRRVLTPFAERQAAWWYDPNHSLFNNWSGVCAGSILAACESFAALGHPRPAAREKAIHVLNEFYLNRAFTPAGECDEGLGYWNYGMTVACIGWSRLSEAELREKVDLDRMRQVADYPRRVHLFDNYFFSGNDASLRANPPAFGPGWLAGATNSLWLAEWGKQAMQTPTEMRFISTAFRVIDEALAADVSAPIFPPADTGRYIVDQQAILCLRGPLAITFAGGHNGEAHNHNDVGHFSLWHDKKLIVPDLGAPVYKSDFFGPNRYTYLTASSRGHCCPIVNGHEQRVGSEAAATIERLEVDQQRMVIEAAAAYPVEAQLLKWTRSLAPASNGYAITDTFVTGNDADLESVVWSLVEPVRTADGWKLGAVTLTVSPAAAVSVEAIDPAPHLLRDYKETIYRIAVTLATRANTPLTTTLTFAG